MSATISSLADPPAEDLDSLEPISRHSYEWKPRSVRFRGLKSLRPEAPPKTADDAAIRDGIEQPQLEARLNRLEGIVRDCALVLRSNVAHRLDKLETSLDEETTRLDGRLHDEARRRCRLLTEVAQKVSAAIDQMRLEKRSA